MEFVQPIRSREKIAEIKNILAKSNTRDLLLFVMGINSGLRISDLIALKVKDVRSKSHIEIVEIKTQKDKCFIITPTISKILYPYIENMADDEYLFQSRNGQNLPITRIQAYRIINSATKKAGITDKIGTHTLRKTFGYHHYSENKDVAILQTIFNHSSPSITLKYIGITQDEIDKSYSNFSL